VNPCDDFYSFACGNVNRTNNFIFTHFKEAETQIKSIVLQLLTDNEPESDPDLSSAVMRMKNFIYQCINQSKCFYHNC